MLHQVTDESTRVVSFDLFRTVLDRPCGVNALMKLLSAESGMDIDEFISRRNAQGGWWSLRDTDSQLLKDREMALECRLIQFRESIVELAQAAKDAGKTVIVITDNYIPSELLTKALKPTRFPFDRIYSSADTGHTKEDGSLFDVVLKDLAEGLPGLEPRQVLHIGDNMVSDVLNAEANGIRAVHYPAASELFCGNFLNRSLRPVTVGDELIAGYLAGRMFDDPYAYCTETLGARPKMVAAVMFPLVFGCCAGICNGDSSGMSAMFSDLSPHRQRIVGSVSEHAEEGSPAMLMLESVFSMESIRAPVQNLCSGLLGIIGEDVPHLRFSIDVYVNAADEIAERCTQDPLLSEILHR